MLPSGCDVSARTPCSWDYLHNVRSHIPKMAVWSRLRLDSDPANTRRASDTLKGGVSACQGKLAFIGSHRCATFRKDILFSISSNGLQQIRAPHSFPGSP